MKYLSVCSGIEAATVAWHPLGWEAFAYSEIEKYPSALLAHHYPDTPNFGDMTKFKEWPDANIDVLVGGTPCQSFSIAGLRKGLDDPRGNLMLTYLAIADKYRPKWLVWENVPGVLSSNGGKDFGALLGGLGELGYGFAYRVLDAQHFGVPQRRRRVFVVACIGDWRSAAAVLFERESMCGNTAPSRNKGQEVAGTLTRRTGISRNNLEEVVAYASHGSESEVASTLIRRAGGFDLDTEMAIVHTTASGKETFGTLMANCGQKQWLGNQEALSGDYHIIQPVSNGIQANIIGMKDENGGNGLGYSEEIAPTLTKMDKHAVAFKMRGGCEGGGKGYLGSDDMAFTVSTGQDQQLFTKMQVRRLTPKECERLQGFPDEYTNIPNAADSGRYKALGNSMAVPVMKWIAERINAVEAI